MDTYAHVLPESQRQAVEGITGLFDAATSVDTKKKELIGTFKNPRRTW